MAIRVYDVYDFNTNEKKGEFLNVQSTTTGIKVWYLANDGFIRSSWLEEIYIKRADDLVKIF